MSDLYWLTDAVSAGGRPNLKTKPHREMRLSPELVASVLPYRGPATAPEGLVRTTADEHAATIAMLTRDRPPGSDVWIFAYGSLICNPACEFVEERVATARGWHRSFCLGWNTVFRGSLGRP